MALSGGAMPSLTPIYDFLSSCAARSNGLLGGTGEIIGFSQVCYRPMPATLTLSTACVSLGWVALRSRSQSQMLTTAMKGELTSPGK